MATPKYIKNWYRQKESNLYSHVRSVVYYSLYYGDMFGVPPRTRTLTNSFGDCHAAITLEIHDWRTARDSNP